HEDVMLVVILVGRYAGEQREVAPHAALLMIQKGDARRLEEPSEEAMKVRMKETVVSSAGKLHAGEVYEVPDAEGQGHVSTGLAEEAGESAPPPPPKNIKSNWKPKAKKK
ncbi:hypothetical protein LCGC14_1556310, partial [marine sediment metagenome]